MYTVVVPLYAMLFFGDEDAALSCRGGENSPVEESYFRGQNDRLGYRGPGQLGTIWRKE